MKKLFTLFFLIIISSVSYGQKLDVKASLNNTFRYGNGLETNNTSEYPKEYLEDLGDARLKINDFVFGMRYEISDPIEYGNDFKGIRKRYLEYNNLDENLSIRVGDYWDLVSRGLTFNVFEDRGLAYDTGIDGVRVAYKRNFGEKNPVKTKTQVFAGDLNYTDYINLKRTETYKIRDANFEVVPLKNINIGINYMYAKGSITSNDLSTLTNITAELPEAYMTFNYKDLQFFYSYAHKHVLTDPNSLYLNRMSAFGNGMYSSLSFSKPGFGFTIDYKNYRFDLTDPSQRDRTRPTKMLPFQNPPTALKEHTSTLISRNPHVVDFNDEVGGQLDMIASPSDKLNLNLNIGIASRHYEYNYINAGWVPVERSTNFLPSLDDKFSPFWEVYFESEYYASKAVYGKVAFSKQSEVTYSDLDPLESEKLFTSTIPVEFRYSLTKDWTLKLIAEQQWIHNSSRFYQKDYNNNFFSLSMSRSPDLTLTINTEITNDDYDPSGKKNWVQGEIAYKLTTTHILTASYGAERGGLKCTSGICRYVYPFNGFRLSLSSKF